MKKKILKFLLTIVLLTLVLSTIFFIIDYSRVTQDKNPLFCIKQTAVLDGGTQIFIGLGYKVISYNSMISLEGDLGNLFYTNKKIGPLFMSYDDFEVEKSKYEQFGNDIISYYKENAIDKDELKKEAILESTTFYAEITQINDKTILVDGLNINDINHKYDFSVSLTDAKIYHNGTEIKKDDLKVGNIVSITYGGGVQETAPARILQTYSISILDNSENTSNNNSSTKQIQTSNDKYNTAPNVTMEIKGGTLTPFGATVVIKDKNEKPFTYGASFKLQRKVNNAWKEMQYLENGGSFVSIGYLTDENGVREIETDWTNHYGKLEPGEYKIIKEVYDNSQEYENYEDGIRYFSTEFVIE